MFNGPHHITALETPLRYSSVRRFRKKHPDFVSTLPSFDYLDPEVIEKN